MGNSSNHLTQEELKQLEKKYDTDGNGLDLDECKLLAEEVRIREGVAKPLPNSTIESLFKKLDKDGSGKISSKEFSGLFALLQVQREKKAKAKASASVPKAKTSPRASRSTMGTGSTKVSQESGAINAASLAPTGATLVPDGVPRIFDTKAAPESTTGSTPPSTFTKAINSELQPTIKSPSEAPPREDSDPRTELESRTGSTGLATCAKTSTPETAQPTSVQQKAMGEIQLLLRELSLPLEYEKLFSDEGIELMDDLQNYTESDLVELGCKRAHVKRLLKAMPGTLSAKTEANQADLNNSVASSARAEAAKAQRVQSTIGPSDSGTDKTNVTLEAGQNHVSATPPDTQAIDTDATQRRTTRKESKKLATEKTITKLLSDDFDCTGNIQVVQQKSEITAAGDEEKTLVDSAASGSAHCLPPARNSTSDFFSGAPVRRQRSQSVSHSSIGTPMGRQRSQSVPHQSRKHLEEREDGQRHKRNLGAIKKAAVKKVVEVNRAEKSLEQGDTETTEKTDVSVWDTVANLGAVFGDAFAAGDTNTADGEAVEGTRDTGKTKGETKTLAKSFIKISKHHKCPNCDFVIMGHPTHCCLVCAKTPRKHSKRCKQLRPEDLKD